MLQIISSILGYISSIFLKEAKTGGELVPEYIDKTSHYKLEMEDCQLDLVISIFRYTPIFRSILERFKYKHEKHLQNLFYPYFQELFEKNIIKQLGESENMIIIPVPMFIIQHIGRGYNQSKLLACQLSQVTSIPFLSVCHKIRPTKHQAQLDRDNRKTNLVNAFKVKKKHQESLAGKTVIIVDDVISTGSTANIIAQELKKYGVKKVVGVFLASGKS